MHINKNQPIYYLDENYIVKEGIYKGDIYSLPAKSISHIHTLEEGNILINSDMIFESRQEAEEY